MPTSPRSTSSVLSSHHPAITRAIPSFRRRRRRRCRCPCRPGRRLGPGPDTDRPDMKRLIVIIVALAAALLVQLTIVNGLALPGGGAPDLVLLCVVAIGLVGGAEPGLIAGFCAGLALDLAPPANELLGQYALVFCLIGYGCGRMTF